MRVTRISHSVRAQVRQFVGEAGHHIAWSQDQDDHVALASASDRTVAGITLHTVPLEQNSVRALYDAAAPC